MEVHANKPENKSKWTKAPRFLRWLLKPTSESKVVPTDLVLDDLKSRLTFVIPPTYRLIRMIMREEIKLLFLHRLFTLKSALIFGIVVTGMATSYFSIKWFVEPIVIKHIKVTVKTETPVYYYHLRSFDDFWYEVAMKESGNNQYCVTKDTMLGLFGIYIKTLHNHLKIKVSIQQFLENKPLQIGVFRLLLDTNSKCFHKYIENWDRKTIKNVKGTVTESGILMAFHLCPEDAKVFFNSGGEKLGVPHKRKDGSIRIGDGNGTTVNTYVQRFSGFETK